MQFSDLNYIESATANVEGGWGSYRPQNGRDYFETDTVKIKFDTTNNFDTYIDSNYKNSAAAGAKGDAYTLKYKLSDSYSKADSGAVVYEGGDSFSFSSSAAAVGRWG